MKELADALIAFEGVRVELLPKLHAPAEISFKQKGTDIAAKHKLLPSHEYCLLLYDKKLGFSKGKEKLKKTLGGLECNVKELQKEYAENLEKQLFGEINYFSFGANKQCYLIYVDVMHDNTLFHLTGSTFDKVDRVAIGRELQLPKKIVGLKDIYLSKGHTDLQQTPNSYFTELVGELAPNERILVSSDENVVLVSTEITKDTKMLLDDYLTRSGTLEQKAKAAFEEIYKNNIKQAEVAA